MGNCFGRCSFVANASEEDSDEPMLDFDNAELMLIKNPNPSYKGYLMQYGSQGRLVARTEYLTPTNKYEAIMLVYNYMKSDVNDRTVGTYVVLQVLPSGRYMFAKDTTKLRLRKGEELRNYPTNAEDITTLNDPRVFLMKPSQTNSSEFVFASCFKESKDLVITLIKPNKKYIAALKNEGSGSADAKQFELIHISEFTSDGNGILGVTPVDKTQSNADNSEIQINE